MSRTESSAKNVRRAIGAGPRWKNCGGAYSISLRGERREKGEGTSGRRRATRRAHPSPFPLPPALFIGEDVAELLHLLERLARAAHDAGERILGDDHRQAGFLHQETVE